MSTLRQEYWDTTNAYIISQYQRASDLLEWVSQSIAASNIELANAKLSRATAGSGWSSGGNGYMTWQDYLALQNYINNWSYLDTNNNDNVWSQPEISDPNLNR